MDVNCPYIEFKVTMNIPCRGKSHLFIGLVDKSKYKYENLGRYSNILYYEKIYNIIYYLNLIYTLLTKNFKQYLLSGRIHLLLFIGTCGIQN